MSEVGTPRTEQTARQRRRAVKRARRQGLPLPPEHSASPAPEAGEAPPAAAHEPEPQPDAAHASAGKPDAAPVPAGEPGITPEPASEAAPAAGVGTAPAPERDAPERERDAPERDDAREQAHEPPLARVTVPGEPRTHSLLVSPPPGGWTPLRPLQLPTTGLPLPLTRRPLPRPAAQADPAPRPGDTPGGQNAPQPQPRPATEPDPEHATAAPEPGAEPEPRAKHPTGPAQRPEPDPVPEPPGAKSATAPDAGAEPQPDTPPDAGAEHGSAASPAPDRTRAPAAPPAPSEPETKAPSTPPGPGAAAPSAPAWALPEADADALAARMTRQEREEAATWPPVEAFDALYDRTVRGLTRQAYLLTGHGKLAEWAVRRAFHQAWEQWPKVAVDRDPAGWVRAAVHERALSPWHQLRPAHRTPDAYAGVPEDRELLTALLTLPPVHRRVLLLHDGMGIGLAETAAETEASTPATAARLLNAREALAGRVAELVPVAPERRGARVGVLLRQLAAAQVVEPPPAREVRSGSDRLTRGRTAAACGLTAAVVAATSFTIATTEHGSLLPQTSLTTAVRQLAD